MSKLWVDSLKIESVSPSGSLALFWFMNNQCRGVSMQAAMACIYIISISVAEQPTKVDLCATSSQAYFLWVKFKVIYSRRTQYIQGGHKATIRMWWSVISSLASSSSSPPPPPPPHHHSSHQHLMASSLGLSLLPQHCTVCLAGQQEPDQPLHNHSAVRSNRHFLISRLGVNYYERTNGADFQGDFKCTIDRREQPTLFPSVFSIFRYWCSG